MRVVGAVLLICVAVLTEARKERPPPPAEGRRRPPDPEGFNKVVKETKFIKGKNVGVSDNIPEELLGPTTKGTCTEVHVTIPLVNKKVKALDFGECYDYRNALCKDSKCRCLKGQKLSKDGEYCIAPDVCTSHTGVACGKIMGMFGGTCPGWSGAVCENDQCVCKEDSDKPCATLVTGYWAWKDQVPKCGTRKGATCIKNTLGTCMMAAISSVLVDKVGGKIPVVGGAIADAAKTHVLTKIPGNVFGERGSCFKWRDAICAPPVTPSAAGAVGNTVEAGLHVIDGGLGTVCMCRPTDCAVWSKKNGGFTCVYSSLLALDKAIVKDFESLTETIYSNITLAMGGVGRDNPADFFEDKRELLRQYPKHAACVRSMQIGSSEIKPECKQFLCEFARSTKGSFHFADNECGLRALPTMLVPGAIMGVSLLGLGLIAFRVDRRKIMTKVTSPYVGLSASLDVEDTAA